MRIIFVLTYPTHYSMADAAGWLRWDNRDRRMAGILAEQGIDVELWGVARQSSNIISMLPGVASYPIRLFAPNDARLPDRIQTSDALLTAAAKDQADLFVLIGSNGAVGLNLFDRVLSPFARKFAVILGGAYWSRLVPYAISIFYESDRQRTALSRSGWRWWRPAIPATKLHRLPKTIDSDKFVPSDREDRWDLIATSRLSRYKHFDELATFAERYRVAVMGDGSRKKELTRRYPQIDWLGHVPHDQVPQYLQQARAFFHAGRREYFPRAIPEAMACGLPVIAFDDWIGPDVIPAECGLLVRDDDYRTKVKDLLANASLRTQMGHAARAHAVATHGPRSSVAACRRLIEVAG